jgi:hypothetical protein
MNAARSAKPSSQPVKDASSGVAAASHGPASVRIAVRLEVIRAFHLLLSAFNYARDAQLDPWQLAVELKELRLRGVALSDLRWLIAKGFAEHRRETTVPGDAQRSFRPLAKTDFPSSSAVALTDCGAKTLAEILPCDRLGPAKKPLEPQPTAILTPPPETDSVASSPVKPAWDQQRRELRFGDQIVKRFRVPAGNQEIILQAFEEDGWPHCIDDPLPPTKACDVKGRLLATIKSLNRNQVAPLIVFHGNGRGFQVYWELAANGAHT